MNFFLAQEHARKASRKLVLWFILCVFAVIALVYLVMAFALKAANSGSSANQSLSPPPGWWQPELFVFTFVVVGGLILIGSLYKLARLSGGGSVIASDLGGRQVDPDTREPRERRLLNVVEEMSIASGLPVPEVWIMDNEQGINAFAAGTDPSNAVIGVTRGTLEKLTRSELQGVIAHEYSHILNGDMKLNMRLTGWIFGLVMVSLIGRLLLQSLRFMRGSRDSKGGGAILAIVLLGAAVWIIGAIGILFARMIQAAISRQREFLADAAAVQFTRLPDGIAGALKKIGGYAEHGKIEAAKATEARHMFFASSNLSSMMATHPPLEERIRAIEPNWKGEMLEGSSDPVSEEDLRGMAPEPEKQAQTGSGTASPPTIPGTEAMGGAVGGAMGSAGSVPGMNPATGILAAAAIAEEESNQGLIRAQASLFALLIPAEDSETERKILAEQGYHDQLVDLACDFAKQQGELSSQAKLTRIDTALPWLRRMSPDEARVMVDTIQKLIEADGEIDLFEFMLQQVSKRHLEIGLGLRQPPPIRHKRLADLETEVAQLLAIFAKVSGDPDALKPAMAEYQKLTSRELPVVEMDFTKAGNSLQKMDGSTPIIKRQILRLCLLAAKQDDEINDNEAELLRAIAEALGCALPRNGNGFADLD